MATLRIQFLAGRYHATPFGHHVNEGLIEWPPSPWRLLRALIATGFSFLGWREVPNEAEALIRKLSNVLPSYQLPPASTAHSRHYQPMGELSKGREKTSLVYDTWASTGKSEMLVEWPCELSSVEAAILARLASRLGYLGRSESWIDAEYIENTHIQEVRKNAFPYVAGEHPGHDYEQIGLMAAMPACEYETWQAAACETALPTAGKSAPKKPSAREVRERANMLAPFPPNLVACMLKDTSWWKQHGWAQPPGSRHVIYWRRLDALRDVRSAHPPHEPREAASTVLCSLTSQSGNRSLLPPVRFTLPVAEQFHRAAIKLAAGGEKVELPHLTGRDSQGHPLRGQHVHVHTMPLDLDADGHIDHILLHAAGQLDPLSLKAIRSIRYLKLPGSHDTVQVAFAGSGSLELLQDLPQKMRGQACPVVGRPVPSTKWRSVSPFVPPRFLKPTGRNSLVGQVNSELRSRGLTEAVSIEIDPALTIELRSFIRRRSKAATQPPNDVGFGLSIVFAKPVPGLIALGYGSHFGLGLFKAVE